MRPAPVVVALGDDKYEVSDFSWSLPQLVYVVRFFGNEAAVIERRHLPSGESGRDFDRHAIGAVQSALMMDTVKKPRSTPSENEINFFVTYFYKWCRRAGIVGTTYLTHNLRGRMREYLATDQARALHLVGKEIDNSYVVNLLNEAESKIRRDWADKAALSRITARKRAAREYLKTKQLRLDLQD